MVDRDGIGAISTLVLNKVGSLTHVLAPALALLLAVSFLVGLAGAGTAKPVSECERAVTPRSQQISEPQGSKFSFPVEFQGRTTVWEGRTQMEIEGRIHLLDSLITEHGASQREFAYESSQFTYLPAHEREVRYPAVPARVIGDHRKWRRQKWQERISMRNLLVQLMDVPFMRFYGFSILPLQYEGEMFHDEGDTEEFSGKEAGIQMDGMTQKFRVRDRVIDKKDRASTFYDVSAWIGTQKEKSIYLDTPDLALWNKLGVTLRVKDWRPYGSSKNEGPIKQVLTLKRLVKSEGSVSYREEHQVALPDSVGQEEIWAVASALLRSVYPQFDLEGSKLQPRVEIENIRQGVNIFHKPEKNQKSESLKIGFLVLDTFRAKKIPSWKWGKPHHQIEYEFLTSQSVSEYLKRHEIRPEEFATELRSRLARIFRGPNESGPEMPEFTHEPKMITGLRE